MTLETMDWPADRVARLRQRAVIAHSGAQAHRERSIVLHRIVHGIFAVQLQASYPAEPGSVPVARTAVSRLAARAGVGKQRLDAIKLAVSEAITNAVVHAYPNRTGIIYVRAVILDEQFRVSIIDDGVGPHIPSQTPGLESGLRLIAASADQFTIRRRRKRGTEVDMRWTLHARPTQGPQSAETDRCSPKH